MSGPLPSSCAVSNQQMREFTVLAAEEAKELDIDAVRLSETWKQDEYASNVNVTQGLQTSLMVAHNQLESLEVDNEELSNQREVLVDQARKKDTGDTPR